MTTTPTSLKTALSWATESAFCERSMPYSFTMAACVLVRATGYVVRAAGAETGESVMGKERAETR